MSPTLKLFPYDESNRAFSIQCGRCGKFCSSKTAEIERERSDLDGEICIVGALCPLCSTKQKMLKQDEKYRKEVDKLGKTIFDLNEKLHQKNLELDALHWVWCNGGCSGGVHRYQHSKELSEEIVKIVEGHAKRLRTWWSNRQFRTLPIAQKVGSSSIKSTLLSFGSKLKGR